MTLSEKEILEKNADLLTNRLRGWENNTLRRIGRRVKQYGKMSPSDVKKINNIAVAKQDLNAVISELAAVTGKNIEDVQRIYGDVLESQHRANKPLYDYRGKQFQSVAESRELQAIVNAYAKTTGGTMINLSKVSIDTLGTINELGEFKPLHKQYVEILDKAVMSVSTGGADFHTAMRDALSALGGSSMRVLYPSGITRRLDTAVRQAMMWGAKQASNEYEDMIGEELGCDGIEIDWHDCPRPSHEFMQGKQFALGEAKTINGKFYPSAKEALKRLEDYNCYHYKTPIILGVSEPVFDDKQLAELNKRTNTPITIDGVTKSPYEWTQDMRQLETEIRKRKDQVEILTSSGDTEGAAEKIKEAKALRKQTKALKKKYNNIAEQSGIPIDPTRLARSRGKN